VGLRTAAAASIVATTLAGSCFGQGVGEAAERERRRRAASSPPAVGELVPGATRWAGTVRTQGQAHAVDLVTEVRDAGETWIVRESWKLPDSATETSELAKGSMYRLRHWSRLGPHWTAYEVREGRVTGRRGTDAFGPFPASSTPLSVEVGVPLFAGAGIPQVVASLPLSPGYQMRLWDVVFGMRPPVVAKTLRVVGQEKITVPAGTFPAWRVAIVADEPYVTSMTAWVAVESRRALRLDCPPVGGLAGYTIELQP
jgi:hypothetical protein